MGNSKTRSQLLAEAHDPIPRDFDPEEDGPAQQSDEDSGSGDDEDDLAGTEHYVDVGKSKLRKRDEIALGPEYAGSRISREALLDGDEDSDESIAEAEDSEGDATSSIQFADPEDVDMDVDGEDGDIDSDAAFGESDTEKFKDFTFRGSAKPNAVNRVQKRPTAADFMSDSGEEEAPVDGDKSDDAVTDDDILDIEEQGAEEMDENYAEEGSDKDEDAQSGQGSASAEDEESEKESEDESENESEEGDDEKAQRAELRKIMKEEKRTVVATISEAAKADAEKGNAVKQQRKAFDSLLSVRMVLQKSLIATNSMVAVEENDSEEATDEPYQAAEDAAIKLWNTLDGLRHELIIANTPGQKRKRDVDSSTPSSKIWQRMQAAEVASIDMRQRTLEKWWDKVRGSTAPLTGKLNNNVVLTSVTSIIQDQLAKPESLQKTKRARSCAPMQEKLKIIEDPNIYDDTGLYKTLLNQLVEQRKMESGLAGGGNIAPAQWAVKEAKMRKIVDTKASKGRKMRYTVHEKLQNFMAPEDRGSWEQAAADRFFGTLLGQKMTLREEDMEVDDDEDDVPLEDEGLKLFRS